MIRVVGLDLGQSNDRCAAVVGERREGCEVVEHEGKWGVYDGDEKRWAPLQPMWYVDRASAERALDAAKLVRGNGKLCVTAIRSWLLGTDYTDVVADVVGLPFDVVVPDMGGVGRPVVDLLRKEVLRRSHRGKVRPVITTYRGTARTKQEPRGVHHTVPKIEMVSSVLVMQQQKLLALPDVDETRALLLQMSDYRQRYTDRGNVQFGNVPGAGKNDDLVSALGLLCWWTLRFGVRRLSVFMG